jgi:GH24 family phage-related lysozyme (muramidase)
MIFDKRKGSLLNIIQRPLNVITPYGTYIGLDYKKDNTPNYILSDIRVNTFKVSDLVFSYLSKEYIIRRNKPTLQLTSSNIIGYNYHVSDVELKYGYITVASKRISIANKAIIKLEADKILEKQLRVIGNILDQTIKVELGQPQYDALLVYFFYEGTDKIVGHPIVEMINNGLWFDITDELQTNIRRQNGRVDEQLARLRIDIARIWSFVPSYS